MRILVTGPNGMLGSAILENLNRNYELVPVPHSFLDITRFELVRNFVREAKPDLVIHTAAIPDVDYCELNPEECYRVNVVGTQNLASALSDLNACMVFVSTDYVFDGTKHTGYLEWDVPAPINAYGKSKWLAERIVQSLMAKYYIVRTSWLFSENGVNFLTNTVKQIRENKPLRLVADQFGCPTYVDDLVCGIEDLFLNHPYGIYHLVNEGTCSRLGQAELISQALGFHREKMLIGCSGSEIDRPGKRPDHSTLINQMYHLHGKTLPTTQNAIKRCVEKFLSKEKIL
jgi:dTDP-4-dehydrorhamnose reductase